MTGATQSPPLRVGVWTASSKSGNQFVDEYARALAAAGLVVVDVRRPLRLGRERIDVLHIHWPDQLYWARGGLAGDLARTTLFLLELLRLKRRGGRIVWMVHNLDPHDLRGPRRWLWSFYKTMLCGLVDGVMTVSPGTLDTVRTSIPALAAKPAAAVWHPAYPPLVPRTDRASIRSELGVTGSGRLYGSLGFLRPYKGLEALIAAFRDLPGDADRLVIAGQPLDQAYLASLRAAAAGDPRIVLRAEPLDDHAYADLERACDAIVLPFAKSLHSGSLIHAVSNDVVAITPASPFSCALREEVGTDWVVPYVGSLTAEHLAAVVRPEGRPDLTALQPEVVGQQAAAFYRAIAARITQLAR